MSIAAPGEERRQEIIIVRRNYDQDEGHHGGVWKIAFADFMTAMMCFFLVMWLINAANEQTKAAVASYFNPVKLIDRNSSKKGLEDLGEGASTADLTSEATPDAKASEEEAEGKGRAGYRQQGQERDAYGQAPFRQSLRGALRRSPRRPACCRTSAPGATAAFRRPDPRPAHMAARPTAILSRPDFWSQQVSGRETAEGEKPSGTGQPANDNKPIPPNAEAPADTAPLEPLAKAEPKPVEKPPRSDQAEGEPSKAAVKTADAIREKLAESLGPDSKLAEGLTVIAGEDGVTISVTDQFDFGMFEVGSAVPRRELVLAMEKIGRILTEQNGTLTIDGHTDARPFRNEAYDNWRLSTARAHSAYYMLVRGGLEEERITTVAGHAARKLKDKAEPLAASNRRIEILLDVGG